ncbi:MAG: hypothetical protein KGS72_04575 [Cyanobacteria bacterium REEB67]|nr:hypothetical protein [Cyanobacteria bacterium REEB67]
MNWNWSSSQVENLYQSARKELSGREHEVAHFAEVTGEAALHAAIQEPIDGLTQLTNHVVKPLTGYELPTLHIVDAPPPAKFGAEDWYAETIGTGLGRAFDYIALSAAMDAVGATAALGSLLGTAGDAPMVSNIVEQVADHPALAKLAVSFGKASLMGGIYGAAFIPAKSEHGEAAFFKERAINGIGWALAAGVAGTVAQGTTMAFTGLGVPVENEAFRTSAGGLGTRAVTALLRGSSSGLVKSQTYVLMGQESASSQILSERLIRGITKSVIAGATE